MYVSNKLLTITKQIKTTENNGYTPYYLYNLIDDMNLHIG